MECNAGPITYLRYFYESFMSSVLGHLSIAVALTAIAAFYPISENLIQLHSRAPPPRYFDLRNDNGRNFLPPIRDQQQRLCGSCVAFAAVASAEGAVIRYTNGQISPDYSEGALYLCDGDRQCPLTSPLTGWWEDRAVRVIAESGLYDEASFPYDVNAVCGDRLANVKRSCHRFDAAKIAASQIKEWIMTKGPVISGFTVYTDFPAIEDTTNRGNDYVYEHDRAVQSVIFGHAIALVGWDDSKQAWLVRNSWGAAWNGNGYIWMRYGTAGLIDPASMFDVTYGVSVKTLDCQGVPAAPVPVPSDPVPSATVPSDPVPSDPVPSATVPPAPPGENKMHLVWLWVQRSLQTLWRRIHDQN